MPPFGLSERFTTDNRRHEYDKRTMQPYLSVLIFVLLTASEGALRGKRTKSRYLSDAHVALSEDISALSCKLLHTGELECDRPPIDAPTAVLLETGASSLAAPGPAAAFDAPADEPAIEGGNGLAGK